MELSLVEVECFDPNMRQWATRNHLSHNIQQFFIFSYNPTKENYPFMVQVDENRNHEHPEVKSLLGKMLAITGSDRLYQTYIFPVQVEGIDFT
jgi:hypothetical protein